MKKFSHMKFKVLILFSVLSFALPTFGFNANIKMVNFDSKDQSKILKAIKVIKKVMSSSEFKQKILEHTFEGERKFLDNKGHSNEEILQIILDGAEELHPIKNGQMDIELELMESKSKTVGHTYPDTKRIWINRKYFNSFTTAEIANNLFHEWLHKLGYDHASHYSTERNFSVPYAIGTLMGELAKIYADESHL
jgi:hypothetical protein